MKKTLLLACTFISFATISQAQITKGAILLGGGASYIKQQSKAGTNESDYNSFHITPAIGVAINEKWVIGASAGYSKSMSKPSTPMQKDESNGFSAGLFSRRYTSLGKNFLLFGNGGMQYSRSKREQTFNTNQSRNSISKTITASVAPGIAYAISKRFHLEAYLNDLVNLSYNNEEIEDLTFGLKSTSANKNIGLATNFNPSSSLYIGFRILLGK
ncbi:autotransporter outer membrane beta-barrel domain-containing protein [Flavisolibacter tropicus]|uniref:Autotransporter domain-containing protein n=1 Tax=Flavisolibacter tropicus TaxID=1492898 RepID=A0A172TZQ5_9BACT|nr:autotransporter outer membrane beta-barrel domain-containing protein [Flavisolibacter tropicus]ANE52217.1 hypothetical protein SY85_18705 [Flavisolibacter tropicus]